VVRRNSSKASLGSRCESDEWKLEHDYRLSSFSDLTLTNQDLNTNRNPNFNHSANDEETRSAELFLIKHKYLSLLPQKDNAFLVVHYLMHYFIHLFLHYRGA